MGDDAAVTVTLDSDTANKLSIKVLQKYLGILGNGAVSYQEDGTEKYITPELNMLDKEMKKLFGIDVIDDGAASEDIDVLGTVVSSEDKETLSGSAHRRNFYLRRQRCKWLLGQPERKC